MAGLDSLFERMVSRGASDLHLTAGEPPRMRIDGKIVRLDVRPVSHEQMLGLLKEIAPKPNWDEFSEERDTDFSYAYPGTGRFRANYFRDVTGACAVFRLIPEQIRTLEELGLPAAVVGLCQLKKGLILVTGPTGSGKSTTLASMVDYVNRTRDEHIITIEDPVEFVHEHKRCLVNHREVGTHTRSFKKALRAALREDPDIILCGELRDLESIEIALEMAETGHLVFGTLHTNTAASTIGRIVDVFHADQQRRIRMALSESLKGVVAQNLLPRVGGGRVAAYEVLLVNETVKAHIRDGTAHEIPAAMVASRASGMQILNQALLDLVRAGSVTPEEAWLHSDDRTPLLRAFSKLGIPRPESAPRVD